MKMGNPVVVAGDVCIDWLSIPVEPPADARLNWQIRSGRHMFAVEGGAWLTRTLLESRLGGAATVVGPQPVPTHDLPKVSPGEIVHSLLTLESVERTKDHPESAVWVVKQQDGFAGPFDGSSQPARSVQHDKVNSPLVLLDDTGNQFRREPTAWPAAIHQREPLVVYKVRRPFQDRSDKLCRVLATKHRNRLIALVTADDLREEGADISRSLSWEQTVADFTISLKRDPRLKWLRRCPYVVITFGIEAVALAVCRRGSVQHVWLAYLPNATEGETGRSGKGNMVGFGSVLAAAISGELYPIANSGMSIQLDELEEPIKSGVTQGIEAMHRMLHLGFGEVYDRRKKVQQPAYQCSKVFNTTIEVDLKTYEARLPDIRDLSNTRNVTGFRAWRILDARRQRPGSYPPAPLALLAEEVAVKGLKEVFPDIPVGVFAEFETIDRSEIESYRSIQNLIRGFLEVQKPARPLCLAVFGPPGSGKSYGVKNVAASVGKVTKVEFNVSQWTGSDDLVAALHRVRDEALKGNVPLVFFDEFDATYGDAKLGWLKYFLAPMQDGQFADGIQTHEIGKAIFVFAGGTAGSFAEFRGNASPEHREADAYRAAKLPDFLSRLRGHVDVFGLAGGETNLIRRALVLRGAIGKSRPNLLNGKKIAQIHSGVLRAFLLVPAYEHGSRSIEAILDMSNLSGCSFFDPSALPSIEQLNLHTDGEAFMTLARQSNLLTTAKIEDLAQKIHQRFLDFELGLGPLDPKNKPSHNQWGPLLDEAFKRSSREQAAYYPTLLSAIGCGIAAGTRLPLYKIENSTRNQDLEKLAKMEHDRWIEERKRKQPDHSALEPWELLSTTNKDRDRDAVCNIPANLHDVGLHVVSLS